MNTSIAKVLSMDIETEKSGTTVRLACGAPIGVNLSAIDLEKIAGEISRASHAGLLDELAAQNQEIITTLDQLNLHRIELEKINEELGETNRDVVALYDELDTVQRVGQVVASKLDLTALLQAITDATVDISGAECGGFFRKVPQSANLICQTVGGPLGIALQNCSLVNIDEAGGKIELRTSVVEETKLRSTKALSSRYVEFASLQQYSCGS